MARHLNSAELSDRCRELRRRGHSLRLIAQTLDVSCSTVRYHTRGIVVSAPKTKIVYQRAEMLDATPLAPSDLWRWLFVARATHGSTLYFV